MSKKHYVIWKGKQTGIFDTWSTVQSLVSGLNNAQYMGFPSKHEAEIAFKESYTKALMKRSLAKSNESASKPSTVKSTPPARNTKKTLNFADFNIYCDGACSPNPGKSGSGIAVYKKEQITELWYGLHKEHGTNNTAELHALYEALKLASSYIKQNISIQILSDSKYSIDCITKWAKGWKKKGWTRGKGEEIKNVEVIKHSFSLYEKIKKDVTISHVKGHANVEGNELSDRMAVMARMKAEKNFVQYNQALDIPTILAMPSG
jgi:ribonuclease HI